MKTTKPATKKYVYFWGNIKLGVIKIGCTSNITRRFKELHQNNIYHIPGYRFDLLFLVGPYYDFEGEKKYHKKFKTYKIKGKTIDYFYASGNLIKFLISNGVAIP